MGRFGFLCSQAAVAVIGSAAVALIRGVSDLGAASTMDRSAWPPLVRRLLDAINANDTAAVPDLFVANGTHEDVPAGALARGTAEIAAYVDGQLGQFRDVRIEPVFARETDEVALIEYAFSAIHRETERSVAYRGVLVFELDGGRVRRGTDYYDAATVLSQLGELEATPAS